MNMYIKAMEIGYESNDGIQYEKIKAEIEESIGQKINRHKEHAFLSWFLKNFTGPTSDKYGFNPEGVRNLRDYLLNRSDAWRKSNSEMFIEAITGPFYMKG